MEIKNSFPKSQCTNWIIHLKWSYDSQSVDDFLFIKIHIDKKKGKYRKVDLSVSIKKSLNDVLSSIQVPYALSFQSKYYKAWKNHLDAQLSQKYGHSWKKWHDNDGKLLLVNCFKIQPTDNWYTK